MDYFVYSCLLNFILVSKTEYIFLSFSFFLLVYYAFKPVKQANTGEFEVYNMSYVVWNAYRMF